MPNVKKEIVVCPVCDRTVGQVEDRAHWFGKKYTEVRRKHALLMVIGYSDARNGWGMRRDFVPIIETEDLCGDCFAVVREHAESMQVGLARRRAYPDEADDNAALKKTGVMP